MKGFFKNSALCFFTVFAVLVSVSLRGEGKGNNKPGIPGKESLRWLVWYNMDLIYTKSRCPNAGSLDYLRTICSIKRYAGRNGKSILMENKKEHFGFTGDLSARPNILKDKLDLEEYQKPSTGGIKLKLLFRIDDDFKQITSILKIGSDVYFLLPDLAMCHGKLCDGLYRINQEKWFEPVTGTVSHIIACLGRNRVVAYNYRDPYNLWGFNGEFTGDLRVPLPDFRLRQELHKLDDRRFLFHNLRMHHSEYAVEIYDISGRRTLETFNNTVYHYPSKHWFSLETMTRLATDKRGHFYIAFQYPQNPYRVWKYDKDGNKKKVFGFYLDDPERYEGPEDLMTQTYEDLQYYGMRQLCVIDNLLVDHLGYIYVLISHSRIVSQKRMKPQVPAKQYLDVYSPGEEYIGRVPFDYGFPEVIHARVIYSRKKVDKNKWIITAVDIEGLQ